MLIVFRKTINIMYGAWKSKEDFERSIGMLKRYVTFINKTPKQLTQEQLNKIIEEEYDKRNSRTYLQSGQ